MPQFCTVSREQSPAKLGLFYARVVSRATPYNPRVHLLRRFVRRFMRRFLRRLVRGYFSRRFNRLYRSRDVGVRHLPVMFVGNDRAVTQPSRRNVSRELVRQFGRSARPQIVE
ncbi:MAG: hypothetical protein ACK5SA_04195 [Planctomycetota bacterium]